jgi:hypothetical protein
MDRSCCVSDRTVFVCLKELFGKMSSGSGMKPKKPSGGRVRIAEVLAEVWFWKVTLVISFPSSFFHRLGRVSKTPHVQLLQLD